MRATIAITLALAALLMALSRGDQAIAAAQTPGKTAVIGVLGPRSRADGAQYVEAFLQGMRERGWIEGKNLVVEYRFADGEAQRLPALAAELVRLNVGVIMATSSLATASARKVTSTVPIVMATGTDGGGAGLVTSLARPEGNVTGMSFDVGLETFGKSLELLKECLPGVRRVAALANGDNPTHASALQVVRDRARALGLHLQVLSARGANDIPGAFASMARERAEAVVVMADSVFGRHRKQIQVLVDKQRLPSVYGLPEHVDAGGLMSYGPELLDNFRRAATYVDRILKGARPSELPVEQPTKFELVINLKTAKALGLVVPASVLARADRTVD